MSLMLSSDVLSGIILKALRTERCDKLRLGLLSKLAELLGAYFKHGRKPFLITVGISMFLLGSAIAALRFTGKLERIINEWDIRYNSAALILMAKIFIGAAVVFFLYAVYIGLKKYRRYSSVGKPYMKGTSYKAFSNILFNENKN